VRSGLAVLALVAVLGPSACGGGRFTGGSSSPRRTPAPAEADRGFIEDRLGFDQDGILARQSRVEARLRTCMRAKGFRYIPVDPVAQRAAVTGAARLSDADFVHHFGYGVSTLWGRDDAGAERNRRVRAGLNPARRRAYDRALWGARPGASFQAAADSGDFTALGGCTRSATAAVFGGGQVLTRLVRALDDLDGRIAGDPRMVRALARWGACMAAAGFHYDDPDTIDGRFVARMEAIVGPVPGPFERGPADREAMSDRDDAALVALQHEEVATARADLACEQRYVTPVESVVRPRYEARFRRRNAALISQVQPVR
jgi:hypothetical protein